MKSLSSTSAELLEDVFQQYDSTCQETEATLEVLALMDERDGGGAHVVAVQGSWSTAAD